MTTLYRTKADYLKPHTLPFPKPFKGISAPDGYILSPEQCLATGEYLDISPTPEAGFMLGEVATWDEELGTVTMDVVAIPLQPVYIPQEISRAKGLVICKQYGILDTIKSVVAAKDADDGISQIKFDNAGTFRRDDPLLQYVAGLVGLTGGQLDQMFIEGEALWD